MAMASIRACCGADAISFTAMVAVEIGFVGFTTFGKAAMANGINRYAFVVYYQALATLILLPAFIFQRKRPPLTFSLLCRFFLLGLIGTSGIIFGLTGLDYSSPTLSSALSNLVPSFTFILACIFGMEKLDIRSRSSQAKALGTIVSVAGAIIATLYKGQPMITQSPSSVHQLALSSPQPNWVIGGFFLAASWISMSIWYTLQAATVKEYPAKLSLAFFYCFFVSIQSAIFTLIAERNLNAWRVRPGIELIAIVYAALIGSILNVIVHTWCLHMKGPIYVAIFKPFGIVIAVIMSSIFLGDTLYTGSVIGSIIITFGFYGVLWGKSNEEKVIEDVNISSLDSSPGTPLLVNVGNITFKTENDRKGKGKAIV